jgi:lipopolysaccharide/colanic/teichoic acid biosynthesis glycosyltransferase
VSTVLPPPAGVALRPDVDGHDLLAARRARAEELRRRHGLRWRDVAGAALRVVDLLAVLLVAPFALLVLAIAAVAIRIDDGGPVLFSQLRTGRHGRRFRIWKIRTMVVGADAMKESLLAQGMQAGPAFKLERDPRVTRVGAVLRKLNIDELPQLWNVLRGDMSLVGPRPTSAAPDDYELWQTARLSARPGITGAWQVTPRKNDMPFDDRVRVDIRHLRSRTFRGDMRLIARTITRSVGRAQGM